MIKIIDFNNYSQSKNINQSLIVSNKVTITNSCVLHILIGIPGSGKSTYANKYFHNPNTIIISSDEIRKELTGKYSFCAETNNFVFDTVKNRIEYF